MIDALTPESSAAWWSMQLIWGGSSRLVQGRPCWRQRSEDMVSGTLLGRWRALLISRYSEDFQKQRGNSSFKMTLFVSREIRLGHKGQNSVIIRLMTVLTNSVGNENKVFSRVVVISAVKNER